MSGLLHELKRRNVLRVGVLYVVIAWIILQVAGLLAQLLELPPWSGKLILALLLLGFPLILVFAWAFEITPEGIKRESEIDRTQSITPQTGRKINLLTGVLGGVAILLIVAQAFIPGLKPAARESSSSGPPAANVSRASIAVLPFVNMSSDKEQEYFSDGLSEELLNLLAKIPHLTVISRTSSFQFKGKNEDVRTIGQKLGVAHVLEGSVRKSADTIRITAQLVNAVDGSHVWSDTYDRPLNNIFAVQDEIAGEVVKALQLKLLGAIPQVAAPDNAEAYDLLLKARAVINRRRSAEDFTKAIALVEQAIDLDPKYARAWADLSRLAWFQAISAYVPYKTGFEKARRTAQRAIELAPRLPEAYIALAAVETAYDWDWSGAAAHIRQAEALDPANTLMLSSKAGLARNLGRVDEAIALRRRILERDPLATFGVMNLANNLVAAGRTTEARQYYNRALEISPELGGVHQAISQTLLLEGKPEEALIETRAETDAFWRSFGLPLVYHALGRQRERDASLQEFEKCCTDGGTYQLAQLYAYIGRVDTAFKWLESAYQEHDPGMIAIKMDPLFPNLMKDPRFRAMLAKMKLLDS